MVINNATADAATNLFISATPSSKLSIFDYLYSKPRATLWYLILTG
jgi:hypothetical protein